METVRFAGLARAAGSMDVGLKLQLDATGIPLQLKAMTPTVGSAISTLIGMVPVPPATTVTLAD
jgi:hypothetical protein